jgi:hypothetical protein
MDIISYVHKSVELLFQILGLIEVWTHRSIELSHLKSVGFEDKGQGFPKKLFLLL